MADYINKQAVLNLIDDFDFGNYIAVGYDTIHEFQKLYDAVDSIPPADVVEVVKCKDCRFRQKIETIALGAYHICILDGSQAVDPDYFCAHGDKDGENDAWIHHERTGM